MEEVVRKNETRKKKEELGSEKRRGVAWLGERVGQLRN